MNSRIRFLWRVTWKAFRSRRIVVILLSLFLGLAVGLVWLAWDAARAGRTYFAHLWKASGMPFYIRGTQPDPGRFTTTFAGPVDTAVYRALQRQSSDAYALIPWNEGERVVRKQTIRWVATDVDRVQQLRPWFQIRAPHTHTVWINPLYFPQSIAWQDVCAIWRLCDGSPGQFTSGHEPYAILIRWDVWAEHVRPEYMDWIEGRWFGDPARFQTWKQAVEQRFGVTVFAHHPSVVRFRSIARSTQAFLTFSGWGLTIIALLTIHQVMLLDARLRRREWAIWKALGAGMADFGLHGLGLAVCWTALVLMAVNAVYWMGRLALHWVIPELVIRPSVWEGPLVAILVFLLCILALSPVFWMTWTVRPANWLRGE